MTVLNAADAVYLGDQAADRVYLGSELVWEAGEAPPAYEPGEFLGVVANAYSATSSVASLNLTLTRPVAVGTTLIGVCRMNAAAALSSITDSKGNHWQIDHAHVYAGQVQCIVFRCHPTRQLETGDTITLFQTPNANQLLGLICQYGGADYVKDLSESAQGASAPSFLHTASRAIASAPQLVVFGAAFGGSASRDVLTVTDALPTPLDLSLPPTGQWFAGLASGVAEQRITPAARWNRVPNQVSAHALCSYRLLPPDPGEFVGLIASGGTTNTASNTTEIVGTVTQATLPGTTLLAHIKTSVAANRVAGVTDTKGNTWTIDLQTTSTAGPNVVIARCEPTTPLEPGDTITGTVTTASNGMNIAVGEYGGRGYTIDIQGEITVGSALLYSHGMGRNIDSVPQLVVFAVGTGGTPAQTFSIAPDPAPVPAGLVLVEPADPTLRRGAMAVGVASAIVTPYVRLNWTAGAASVHGRVTYRL